MPHFTYKNEIHRDQLCQGDLLQVTDGIKEIFRICHPYFLRDEYRYFIVLTQTCDLVLRGSCCKSKYITIAAVRSFHDYLIRATENYTKRKGDLILLEENKQASVQQLLERVLNNNESEHFYLSEDASFDFYEPMVACLKVSIALKSELHYQTCLSAKVLELTDEFKAKLGWLVGQMYSRVGTPDWESENRKDEYNQRISEIINSSFIVAKKPQLSHLIKIIEDGGVDTKDLEAVKKVIDDYIPETNQDKMFNILEKIFVGHSNLFKSREGMDTLLRDMRSSVQIRQLIKKD